MPFMQKYVFTEKTADISEGTYCTVSSQAQKVCKCKYSVHLCRD